MATSGLSFTRAPPETLTGTHLVGYLYISPGYPPYDGFPTGVDLFDPSWKFENLMARIITLGEASKQDVFRQCDDLKSNFELEGTYKGEPFSLYDYKGSRGVNIGGTNKLDVKNLMKELAAVLKVTQPKPFSVKCNYTGRPLTYKN